MILVCPECSTCYDLPSGLPEGGTKVRCTGCAHVWHATDADLREDDPAPEEAVVEEEAAAVEDAVAEEPEPDVVEAVSPFDEDILEDLDFDEAEEEVEDETNSQNDIDGLFDEPAAPIEASSEEASEDSGEDNSQDDIDGLFDEPAGSPEDSGEDNSQDDIDGLFDEPADEGDDNSQDEIDGLFDEPADEGDDNSQDDVDGMFDAPADSGDDNSQDDVDNMFDGPADTPEVAEVSEDPFASMEIEEEEVKVETVAIAASLPFWKRIDQKTIVGWACYVVVLGVISVFMIAARVSVVRAIPAMAGVYSSMGMGVNVRGVMFTNVQQRWETRNDTLELRVDGEITNLTNKYKTMPNLVLTALSKERREVFRWVVQVRNKPLLPGEKAPFLVRMPAPPTIAKHLLLKFE